MNQFILFYIKKKKRRVKFAREPGTRRNTSALGGALVLPEPRCVQG